MLACDPSQDIAPHSSEKTTLTGPRPGSLHTGQSLVKSPPVAGLCIRVKVLSKAPMWLVLHQGLCTQVKVLWLVQVRVKVQLESRAGYPLQPHLYTSQTLLGKRRSCNISWRICIRHHIELDSFLVIEWFDDYDADWWLRIFCWLCQGLVQSESQASFEVTCKLQASVAKIFLSGVNGRPVAKIFWFEVAKILGSWGRGQTRLLPVGAYSLTWHLYAKSQSS